MNALDFTCPVCYAGELNGCVTPQGERRVTHRRREQLAARESAKWMKATFSPRDYPEAIFLAPEGNEREEEVIAGPFCRHCGNPLSMHGPGCHCPKSVLHPLFPGPSCTCHGEAANNATGVRP